MEEIDCILCGIPSNHVCIEENGYQGKRCPRCGLIFISPRPSIGEVFDLYGHDAAYISAESHISNAFPTRLCARHHLRIIRSFIKSGNLLEIGAGAGYFLDEARKSGFTPYALEFNPIQASFIREKLCIPCEESSLSATVFDGKKFDVVYHCDVISHFYNPISDFKTINEIMNDDGFMIFETGNLAEVDQRYLRYFQRFQYPDHLFFFSVANLVILLERTGFELVGLYRYPILPQLITINLVSRIKSAIKTHYALSKKNQEKRQSDANSDGMGTYSTAKSHGIKDVIKGSLKMGYEYFSYLLRYKIGGFVPKVARPQTVVIVAKKRIKN